MVGRSFLLLPIIIKCGRSVVTQERSENLLCIWCENETDPVSVCSIYDHFSEHSRSCYASPWWSGTGWSATYMLQCSSSKPFVHAPLFKACTAIRCAAVSVLPLDLFTCLHTTEYCWDKALPCAHAADSAWGITTLLHQTCPPFRIPRSSISSHFLS